MIRLTRFMMVCILATATSSVWAQFRVQPYVQNPTQHAMTVMWFSMSNTPGQVTYTPRQGGEAVTHRSMPVVATALGYNDSEKQQFSDPGLPYQHKVRLTDLYRGTTYDYCVTQDAVITTGSFRTAPDAARAVRFIIYGDCETEPESTGVAVDWAQPFGDRKRPYLVDQTTGYAENLRIIKLRDPDFVAIAGDLVETGGEQRDWDEFWRHNAGVSNALARCIPIMPATGNHEQFGGPGKGYDPLASNAAMAKYLTYFDLPNNHAPQSQHQGRYYRMDYGPVTLIALDVTNGQPHQSQSDTNWLLADSNAADFTPGSQQYQWLTVQLADAQKNSRFTFVIFHHVPYSSGPHGFATGEGSAAEGKDNQSGVPVRILTPLFQQYGVDALFAGHDEMYERSVIPGREQLPGGNTRDYDLQVYDIGIGGDGLRGPARGKDGLYDFAGNEFQAFLAHLDAPEVWNGKQLIRGGKHYGHLEVNVYLDEADGLWKARLDAVYVFPLMNTQGQIIGWERRLYDDTQLLTEPM